MGGLFSRKICCASSSIWFVKTHTSIKTPIAFVHVYKESQQTLSLILFLPKTILCHTLANMLWKNKKQSPGEMTQSMSVVWHSMDWNKVWEQVLFSASVSLTSQPFDLQVSQQLCQHRTKVRPCRQLTASRVAVTLSGSCGNPSNRCVPSHHPTGWTSPCRSPTGDHQHSDMAGPGGGVCWRLVSFC